MVEYRVQITQEAANEDQSVMDGVEFMFSTDELEIGTSPGMVTWLFALWDTGVCVLGRWFVSLFWVF